MDFIETLYTQNKNGIILNKILNITYQFQHFSSYFGTNQIQHQLLIDNHYIVQKTQIQPQFYEKLKNPVSLYSDEIISLETYKQMEKNNCIIQNIMDQFQRTYTFPVIYMPIIPINAYSTIDFISKSYIQPTIILPEDQKIKTNGVFIDNSLLEHTKQYKDNEQHIMIPSLEELTKIQKKSLRKYWSIAEDKQLMKYYKKYPQQWEKISKNLKGRNGAMCYSRYRRLIEGNKRCWNSEIDQKIVEEVSQLGFQWKQISKNIQNKTPKQIRERYLNFLRPNILRTQWTPQEDLKICELVYQYGRTWKKFEDYLIGRTQNQIKARYYGHLKKIMQNKSKKR